MLEAEQSLNLEDGPMATTGAVKIMNLSLNKIKLARNSRLNVSKEEIAGLMQSIKETGLLQPIGVVTKKTGYEVVYGNRRFLACSKLGMTKIPAIIHTHKKNSDDDLKNLTENIQRRNISLTEAGRYIALLKEQDLTLAEISVRLGVSTTYIKSCVNAYSNIPKEFRDDLDIRTGYGHDRKRTPGKISMRTVNDIINSSQTNSLNPDQTKILFKAAKSDERFSRENVQKYASAIKLGKKDPIGEAGSVEHATARFYMDATYKNALYTKYVVNGPFQSLNGLFVAILKGEKSLKLDVKLK